MSIETKNNKFASIFSKKYWKEATLQLKDVRMITIAALIVALRIAVKFFKIRLAPGLNISLDAYVNSLGSVIYGPIIGLVVGSISDILGCIATGQMAEYFFPFMFVEMMSSFIFGLFFWKRKITITRALTSKFTVNFICNIIMTSLFNKWYLYLYVGIKQAQAFRLINGIRIVKNLILFPLEAAIIIIVLSAALPIIARLKLVDKKYSYIEKPSNRELARKIALLTAISLEIIFIYLWITTSK